MALGAICPSRAKFCLLKGKTIDFFQKFPYNDKKGELWQNRD
jgi:hypothetical protein